LVSTIIVSSPLGNPHQSNGHKKSAGLIVVVIRQQFSLLSYVCSFCFFEGLIRDAIERIKMYVPNPVEGNARGNDSASRTQKSVLLCWSAACFRIQHSQNAAAKVHIFLYFELWTLNFMICFKNI
jgi:hypothetical protein